VALSGPLVELQAFGDLEPGCDSIDNKNARHYLAKLYDTDALPAARGGAPLLLSNAIKIKSHS